MRRLKNFAKLTKTKQNKTKQNKTINLFGGFIFNSYIYHTPIKTVMEIDILYFIANQRKILRNELDEFLSGYTGDNTGSIKALTDKIEHMCFNIGCPSSVMPMLESITTGKVKKWSTKSDDRGKQLHGYHVSYIENLYRSDRRDDNSKLVVDTGHFRWDWKGHMLNRDDQQYIKDFFINGIRK